MKPALARLPAFAAVLVAAAILAAQTPPGAAPSRSSVHPAASADAALVARYLGYKTLPRLTARKIDISESVRTMCLDPRLLHGPHLRPGIHLYASPSALETRRAAGAAAAPRYPVGTLFVKEKFDSHDDAAAPTLLTVMEKTATRGRVDDWRFTMIRLSDRTIVRESAGMTCAQCHSRYPDTDFVSGVADELLGKFAPNSSP